MDIYKILWKLGEISGCHQRADRSFSFRGKQFPVCARCTGAFAGYIAGAFVFLFYQLPVWLCAVLCGIMAIDWFIQRIGLLESTNLRRLLTGILCGFGLVQLYLLFILFVVELIL